MSLTFDQALHGYREGHRLLEASRELSGADRQRLAIQTDNSDAGRSSPWESLLSGYPLPSGLYAWSLTWPAPEMPRPGCVWTHTLLVDPTAEIPAAQDLLAAFRRPSADVDAVAGQGYARPVVVPAESDKDRSRATKRSSPALLTALLWSFYATPIVPLRVTGVPWRDEERHGLLISLWHQQWPQLRSRLSLGDAPVSPRRLDEEAYDLQLHQSSRAQQQAGHERVLNGVPTKKPPAWARVACEDLLSPNGLGRFLQAYGTDDRRTEFEPLTRLWIAHLGPEDSRTSKMIDFLVEAFPRPSSVSALKRDLLAPGPGPVGWTGAPSSAEILRALVARKDLHGLPLDQLDLDRRVSEILDHESSHLAEVLASLDPKSPLGPRTLDALLDQPEGSLLPWLAANPPAARRLISHRPQIAALPALWRDLGPDLVWPGLAAVRGRAKHRLAIAAMLAAGSAVDPTLVLTTWDDAPGLVLELLATEPPRKKLFDRWLAAVPPEVLASWINTQHAGLEAKQLGPFLAALPPASLRRTDPGLVVEQLKLDSGQDFAARAFGAALGCAKKPDWAPVALDSYTRLLDPKGRLGKRAIAELDRSQPPLSTAGTWSERLARSLNQALQEGRWDPLLTLSLDRRAFELLIEADAHAGLAKQVSLAGIDRTDLFEPWQSHAIFKNIKARSDRASLAKFVEKVARTIWPF